MRLHKIWNSSAFRLAGTLASLFLLAMGAVLAIIYFELREDQEERLRLRITTLIKTFEEISRLSGAETLHQSIGAHIKAQRRTDSIVVLTDQDGNVIVGNTRPVERFPGWKLFEQRQFKINGRWADDPDHQILAKWSALKHGYLLVGYTTTDVDEIREELLESLGWIVGPIVILSLLAALWFAQFARRRIDAIKTALVHVESGRLDRRIKLSHSGDDIDQVATLINHALERLEAYVANVRQVSSDIAHDLRTPIGRLRQRLEKVSRSTQPLARVQEAISEALLQIDTIDKTFEALLQISQIETGLGRKRFTDVPLRDVLDHVEEAYSMVASEVGQTIVVNNRCDGAIVHGNRELLTQMCANIIENAIRHCPAGAKITVCLGVETGAPVLTISDNGPGIAEEERSKVFRRLYRLEKSRTTPGSGLGLSLVKAIAELHGAVVELNDNNPGLSVVIKFPGPNSKSGV